MQNRFAHLLFIAERKLLLGHEDTVTTVELDVRPPEKSKRDLRRYARDGVSCLPPAALPVTDAGVEVG